MESPAAFPDSPVEDDVVYPCKGCGEILEEGKAFELAGNRWHIDCFRCNTCGTLLDSDANLLLLGDGSLICNNCTYSCSACGDKIEDLAILTGDQAFCASCFRCRNCKRKIENLRYARTSQGIFCMSCHESLMAKRRKHKKLRQANGLNKDKSLPELPPTDNMPSGGAFQLAELDGTPAERFSDTTRSVPLSRIAETGQGPESAQSLDSSDTLTLPASTYSARPSPNVQNTQMSPTRESGHGDDGLFVPFLLDTNPSAGSSPMPSVNRDFAPSVGETSKPPSRDYMQKKAVPASLRDSTARSESQASTRSDIMSIGQKGPYDTDRMGSESSQWRQEPSRTMSPVSVMSKGDDVLLPTTTYSGPTSNAGNFRLQDAPKTKRTGSWQDSRERSSGTASPVYEPNSRSTSALDTNSKLGDNHPRASSSASTDHHSKVGNERPPTDRPLRGDSLPATTFQQAPILDSLSGATTPTAPTSYNQDRSASAASNRAGAGVISPYMNGIAQQAAADSASSSRSVVNDTNNPPSRSSGRPQPAGDEDFTSPRFAPAPPAVARHKPSQSTSTVRSEFSDQLSPSHQSRYGSGVEYTGRDELDRAARGDGDASGVLRKVSNAMKGHGRSFSDRAAPATTPTARWSGKSPINGLEISSPTSAAPPDAREEVILLKAQLRRAQQRIAELETEKNTILHRSTDFSEVDTKLREKRSTMVMLDTQRELVVRELEVMTDHLKKVKDSNQPMHLGALKSDILRDLTASVKELKTSLSQEVEELIQKREDVTNEISELIAMKDKGMQEYEALSNRNVQLSQHNNELLSSIQGSYKANKQPNGTSIDAGRPAPNGLGIQMQNRGQPDDLRQLFGNDVSMPSLMPESEDSLVSTPQVINIKRTKKPNMLKKGTQGFLRGARGIFNSEEGKEREQYLTSGVPYNQIPDNGISRPINVQKIGGLFGNEKIAPAKMNQLKHGHKNSSHSNLLNDATGGAQGLFGGDLTARCDMEKRIIPNIVQRCIEEVEVRGMDVEGIYRKSGGSGQVNQVKLGFETGDYDISDPDLDIHTITSTLKQYFRRLPVPLITFDVYDPLLDAARAEDDDRKVQLMSECMNMLPRAHRDCLHHLLFHLSRVMEKAQFNLMTPLNLAVVFAPTILRPASIEREMTDMQLQRNSVQFLIENHKLIFNDA